MAEPTEGGWHVRHWASKPLISIYADGQRIADMAPGGLLESHANACYMAAAKEAIAELKRLLDVVDDEDQDSIRRVLAKARGEA